MLVKQQIKIISCSLEESSEVCSHYFQSQNKLVCFFNYSPYLILFLPHITKEALSKNVIFEIDICTSKHILLDNKIMCLNTTSRKLLTTSPKSLNFWVVC